MANASLPDSFSINNLECDPLPTGRRFQNLTGQTLGVFTAIAFHECIKRHAYWWCRCNLCGRISSVSASHFKSADYQSCGCLRYEIIRAKVTTHGTRRTTEYSIYGKAKGRCQNPNNPRFKDYGGRGIEFRFDSFETFFAAVGARPSRKHSLDRIDNDGHYEAGNLRWATNTEQVRNSRSVKQLTYRGKTLCAPEWGDLYGISSRYILQRLSRGWCIECSLTHPVVKGSKHKCTHYK